MAKHYLGALPFFSVETWTLWIFHTEKVRNSFSLKSDTCKVISSTFVAISCNLYSPPFASFVLINNDHRGVDLICMCKYFNSLSSDVVKININQILVLL